MPTTPMKVIDLFAGCGGMTQGFADAGFEPIAAVELDLAAAATYAQNFGDHVYVGDIADWTQGEIPDADVVIGGPPCQGFSSLGRQDPKDPRNYMWRHYVDALRRVRPLYFVIENVPPFLRSPEYRMLKQQTHKGGPLDAYSLVPMILNAADHGAPQARKRGFVIGHRKEIPLMGEPEVSRPQTVGDAWPTMLDSRVTETELPQLTTEYRGKILPGPFKLSQIHVTRSPTELSRARYAAIPPGGSRFDLPDDLQTPGWRKHTRGSGDVMGRLRWDRPSVTIRTEFYKPEKGRYLHPEEDRPITHAEAACLQGFDDQFEWVGSKVSIARQIGNAVPPPLGEAIARYIHIQTV